MWKPTNESNRSIVPRLSARVVCTGFSLLQPYTNSGKSNSSTSSARNTLALAPTGPPTIVSSQERDVEGPDRRHAHSSWSLRLQREIHRGERKLCANVLLLAALSVAASRVTPSAGVCLRPHFITSSLLGLSRTAFSASQYLGRGRPRPEQS